MDVLFTLSLNGRDVFSIFSKIIPSWWISSNNINFILAISGYLCNTHADSLGSFPNHLSEMANCSITSVISKVVPCNFIIPDRKQVDRIHQSIFTYYINPPNIKIRYSYRLSTCIRISYLIKLDAYRVTGLHSSTLWKRDPNTGVFLWILLNLSEHSFVEYVRATTSIGGKYLRPLILEGHQYFSKVILLKAYFAIYSFNTIYLTMYFNDDSLLDDGN